MCADVISSPSPPEQFREDQELYDQAREIENNILSLRSSGLEKYFLFVDVGGGPSVFTSIDYLTCDEMESLADVLASELHEAHALLRVSAESELTRAEYIKAVRDLRELEQDIAEGIVDDDAIEMCADARCAGIVHEILEYRKQPPKEVDQACELNNLDDPAELAFEQERPRWDRERFELRLGGLEKHVRPIATNVIRVLDSFQQHDWPDRIDDPLSKAGSTRAEAVGNSERLRSTVRSLNASIRFLRFMSDGQGQGIRWERRSGG